MLDRKNLDEYITETYGAVAEFPWMSTPTNTVYRHSSNKKWFALVMDIPKSKLGLPGDEIICVINLKNDPLMIGSLHKDEGIFPAYHMNKSYWITVLLDGTVEDEKLKWLVDISFQLTDKPAKKNNGKPLKK